MAGSGPAGRSFGEEGGRLTYGTYLRLPELLAQQVPLVDPPAHDELLFITVHQVYELWFKQLLHELVAARDAMDASQTWLAGHLMRRAHVIERLLVSQIDVLETMTPQDFGEFRAALAPASGLQSVQFRELEFLSGAKDQGFIARFRGLTDDERDRLARRLAEPSLWDSYLGLLGRRGLAVGDRGAGARVAGGRGERPGQSRRPMATRRGTTHPRRDLRAVARPARADGRTADRHQIGNRRLVRCAVPAPTRAIALLPPSLGTSGQALRQQALKQ